MPSIQWDAKRNGYRIQLYTHTGKRIMVWLGGCSKKQATNVCKHLEEIRIARSLGLDPPPQTAVWILSAKERIRKILIKHDLIKPTPQSEIPRTLRAFCDWCDREAENLAKNTRAKKRVAANHLAKFFGDNTSLQSITRGDADRFSKHLYGAFLESTAGTNCREAKAFFRIAARNKLIAENPFDDVRVSTKSDQSRREHVHRDVVLRLLDHCPNQLWRTILVLARFGGLAVPSEILSLRWSLVDWKNNRFQVSKKKNIHHENYLRIVPIFPEIRQELTRLFEESSEGNDWVCTRYRSGGASPFRDQLVKILAHASTPPWPKLWINLRASCRTDLERVFPSHVCDAWLGHSAKIAAKHYLMPTDEDYQKACGVAGGVIFRNGGVAGGVIE